MRGDSSRGVLRALLALVVSVLMLPRLAHADEPPPRAPLVFVADPKLGMETSVRSLDSLGRLAFRYEDVLPSFTHGSGKLGLGTKLLFAAGRFLKLLFLDEPIAELTAIVTHEAGGHGARARELALRPTYLFYLPGIYRSLFSASEDNNTVAFTTYETAGIVEGHRRTLGSLGGIEANYVHAWWINARIVRAQGWVHHGDLLVYGVSRLQYSSSFLSSSLDERGGASSDDVASYVTSLQDVSNGWRAQDRRRIAGRLRAGYLWNLLDPTLLYAFYGTVFSSLGRGERVSRMPLPTVRGISLLLSPRFNLTPFGAEQMLDVFFADRTGQMLDLYVRVGTSGLASYNGAGARMLGMEVGTRLRLGGELDVWRQPELLLAQRGVFGPPDRAGVNVGLYGDVQLTRELALTGKLAGKTPGYLMGQPVGGGPHGYLGISLALP